MTCCEPKTSRTRPVVLVLMEAVPIGGDHARTVLASVLQHQQPLIELDIRWTLQDGAAAASERLSKFRREVHKLQRICALRSARMHTSCLNMPMMPQFLTCRAPLLLQRKFASFALVAKILRAEETKLGRY